MTVAALGWVFFVLVAACVLLPFSNPDVYWHLSAAQRILELGRLPEQDWLSFTRGGVPWLDFEWLTQLLWLALYRTGGAPALLACKAALLAGAGAVLWKTLSLYRLALAARGPWLLAWALASLAGNDLRPENFSLLLFGALWWRLELERLAPSRSTASGVELGSATAFFALWANLHAGFAYGLALLALAAALAAPGQRGRVAALLGCAALGSLLNPAGPRLYGVLIEHAAGLAGLSGTIREWQAPALADPWLAPFWALLAVSTAVVSDGIRSRRMPRLHAVLLLLLGVSALRHVRTVPYFAAIAVPVAACALEVRGSRRLRVLAPVGAAALALFAAFRVIPKLIPPRAFVPRYAPERVAGFLEREAGVLGGRRVFHPWEWGGFFGFRLWPSYSIFADGRYIFHDLIHDAALARREPEGFQRLLDRHEVDIAVVRADPQRFEMRAQLRDGRAMTLSRPSYLLFLPRERWALVYWDQIGMVFVRRSALPAGWIGSHEYRLYRPGDLEAAELMVREGLARAQDLEAERELFARTSARP